MRRYFTTILFLSHLLVANTNLFAQRIPISKPAEKEEAIDPGLSWESSQAKWQDETDIVGRFKVISPGKFQQKVDTISTALGDLAYHTYFFQPSAERRENEIYMLTYVDYPEGSLHHDSTELVIELFEETQAAATESVRGELLFSQEGVQKSYPYRYWRIDYLNGRASIRTKALIVGNRFYTVQTVSRREYGINPSTDRFIDSFRVF